MGPEGMHCIFSGSVHLNSHARPARSSVGEELLLSRKCRFFELSRMIYSEMDATTKNRAVGLGRIHMSSKMLLYNWRPAH